MTMSLTLLTSCFYSFYPQTGSNVYPETNPEDILIYSGDIKQEYYVIGSVAADALGDIDTVVKHLKKKASEVGADAIILVDLNKVGPSAGRTGVSGVAVKLKANHLSYLENSK